MRLRGIEGFFEGPKRISPRRCELAGCGLATREGKAYCSAHVEHHPYVQGLLEQLASREAEDDLVARRGPRAANVAGITAQEILQHIAFHGARTEERLCRELNLDHKTLTGYVEALRRARLVKLGRTKRGSTLVRLTDLALGLSIETAGVAQGQGEVAVAEPLRAAEAAGRSAKKTG